VIPLTATTTTAATSRTTTTTTTTTMTAVDGDDGGGVLTLQRAVVEAAVKEWSYFFTNKERDEHNARMLYNSGKPVLRINASNQPDKARGGSLDDAFQVPNILHAREDSRMMWLSNTNKLRGIVNGTCFVAKDFLYFNNRRAPDLPSCLVVDLGENYRGEPFFTDPAKRTWLPLLPEEVEWCSGREKEVMCRIGYPATLCDGLSANKSQGTTNSGYAVPVLGEKEAATNGTYVMVSRATNLDRVWFPGGLTYDRVSAQLAKPSLKERVAEEKRLQALHQSTLAAWAARTGGPAAGPPHVV